MPMLRRNAGKLLRVVGGKQHASDVDHEETLTPSEVSNGGREELEEDINAEPMSSDEESILRRPNVSKPESATPKPSPHIERVASRASRRGGSQQRAEIRAPSRGAYARGRVDRAKRGFDSDKENGLVEPSTSSIGTVTSDGWDFDTMESAPTVSKKQRTTFGKPKATQYVPNIHAPPAKKSIVKTGKPRPPAANKTYQSKTSGSNTRSDEENSSEVSMADGDELEAILYPNGKPAEPVLDPELRTATIKSNPKSTANGPNSSQPTLMADDELEDCLNNGSKILGQLGDWMLDQAPASSQPQSSAPQEDLDNLKSYISTLPEEDTTTRCPICKEPVADDEYRTFWYGRKKTVKNGTAFCHLHRAATARSDYEAAGYPTIDWDALSGRIEAHKSALIAILTNTRSSTHRDRYAPLALTGKAAAAPKRRADLPSHIQEEIETFALDSDATNPGYYGPRGRRLITECVMKLLKTNIKACVDPVVQASGPAAFVQAVLVPETAVLMICEDMGVDREEAERVREKTVEMGGLLNEEIEDRVEGVEEEERNEYVVD